VSRPAAEPTRELSALNGAAARTRAVLERALEGKELTEAEAVPLLGARGADAEALFAVADALRRRQCGDQVGYVVNRNINFTNVCVKSCKFCAFSRDLRSDQAYLLDLPEIVRRAREAEALGATEVCLQAGLLPEARGGLYLELVRALRAALPGLHIHAFSPEEVRYGAALQRVSVRDFLRELRDAGLGSLPGTSAEILDDDVRARIAPGRLTSAQWVEVIATAHELGIPTTATMMFGHVESLEQRARHLALLRSMQAQSGGFTEFVPLSFVHAEAPLFLRGELGPGARGPDADEVACVYAVARLMLGERFRNIQVSWVKQGFAQAGRILRCGANDLGGTLINESISTSAGAEYGQLATPSRLRRLIREAGRVPVQRSTGYAVLRQFACEPGAEEPLEALDLVADPDARFGSYAQLSADPRFRYTFSDTGARGSARGPEQGPLAADAGSLAPTLAPDAGSLAPALASDAGSLAPTLAPTRRVHLPRS
jgi:7,8-didemethyl-8-hydroxy-5-deazariboflavin synthase CofH subunit